MTALHDVLAIGETMVMVTPAGPGGLTADGHYLLRPGGAESNVAAHLAQLGLRSAWASAVGDDPLGRIVTDTLSDLGVDVSRVECDQDRPTAVYFKDPAPSGTRVYYYRDGSAASAMSPQVLSRWASHPPKVVHVSGITAALSPSCRELVEAVVVDRVFGAARVSFDVNYRPALWNHDARPLLRRLAAASDIVFVGRDEAENLWSTTTADSVRELLPEPGHLVVKDGSHEAVSYTPDGTFRVPARRVERIVDVVGAGDAFAAGWLAAMLDGGSEPVCLHVAHHVASRVLGSPTDLVALPPLADIVALVAPNRHTRPVPDHTLRGEPVDVADRGARA